MKRSLLILTLFLSTQVYTQDFEGIIHYENMYENSSDYDEINLEDLRTFLGVKSTFITKQGSYKQISDGRFMSFQIYKPKESKLYYKDLIEGDTLFYKDLKKSKSTKFEYRITKNSDTILGHVCHKLVYKTEDSEEHYYFAPNLKLNPKYFKNYKSGNKNKLSELTKSVYLRYDIFFNGIIFKSVATEIREKEIDESEFDIPDNSILKESTML